MEIPSQQWIKSKGLTADTEGMQQLLQMLSASAAELKDQRKRYIPS
jgi:hypothetical protein